MTAPKSCLLVVGSPKGRGSTSHALGSYLSKRLQGEGLQVEERVLYDEAGSDASASQLVERMGRRDLVMLAYPLYVDSLPSRVIRLMELAAAEAQRALLRGRGLVVIVNSGFPEEGQMSTSVEICRLFAKEMGMEWKGALCLPAGPLINATPLEEAGGRARHQVAGLDIAAKALAIGGPVPDEALAEFARIGAPKWLYVLIANRGWGKINKKRGVKVDLRHAPYR